MTKLVLASSVLFLLCGPALADPSATYQLKVAVTSSNGVRHYATKSVENGCAEIEATAFGASHDSIKVCTYPEEKAIRLDIQWELREGTRELKTRSGTVVSRGATVDVDGGTAKLAVTLQ